MIGVTIFQNPVIVVVEMIGVTIFQNPVIVVVEN